MMQPFCAQRELTSRSRGSQGMAPRRSSAKSAPIQRPGSPPPSIWLPGRAVPRQPRIGRQTPSRSAPQGQPASAAGPGRVRLGRGAHRRVCASSTAARSASSAGSAALREEEGHRGSRAQTDLIVWHRAGHRPALPGSRRRLLHHPHRSRNGETSPHRQARGPRVQGHPRTRHLTAQIHAATNRPGSAALHRVGYACRGHLDSRTTRPSERGDRTMTGWLLIHQRATRKRSSGSQSAPSFVDQARYGPVALAA